MKFIAISLLCVPLAVSMPVLASDRCSLDNQEYDSLSDSDKKLFNENIRMVITNEFSRYALGRDAYVDDKELRNAVPEINPELVELRKLAENRIHKDEISKSYSDSRIYLSGFLNEKLSEKMKLALRCSIQGLRRVDSNLYNRYLSTYIYHLQNFQRVTSGRVGYFQASSTSCSVVNSVKTNNRFSDLPSEVDARYIVLEASFKNLDSESRMPVEGDLIVISNGKEYRFETSEQVLAEGYGLRFRKMNPLITEKTKLVYKVPNELSGEVYWEPGRNRESVRLWCTYL